LHFPVPLTLYLHSRCGVADMLVKSEADLAEINTEIETCHKVNACAEKTLVHFALSAFSICRRYTVLLAHGLCADVSGQESVTNVRPFSP
jgi:hypothetical protein